MSRIRSGASSRLRRRCSPHRCMTRSWARCSPLGSRSRSSARRWPRSPSARASNPLFELETGRISEAAFLGSCPTSCRLSAAAAVELDGFGERYFRYLHPNERMIDYMRELRGRGYKMAICTNNVREWEARWRAMLPVDEIFDVVVDSAFVGSRKPEPRIYEITLERLGASPDSTLFIDDIEVNCEGARAARNHRDPVPLDRAGDRGDRGGAPRVTPESAPGDPRDRAQRVRVARRRRDGCSSGTAAPPSCSDTRARRRSGPSWPN